MSILMEKYNNEQFKRIITDISSFVTGLIVYITVSHSRRFGLKVHFNQCDYAYLYLRRFIFLHISLLGLNPLEGPDLMNVGCFNNLMRVCK